MYVWPTGRGTQVLFTAAEPAAQHSGAQKKGKISKILTREPLKQHIPLNFLSQIKYKFLPGWKHRMPIPMHREEA